MKEYTVKQTQSIMAFHIQHYLFTILYSYGTIHEQFLLFIVWLARFSPPAHFSLQQTPMLSLSPSHSHTQTHNKVHYANTKC